MATLLATLPNFDGLIDAARYHEWQAPVEICKHKQTHIKHESLLSFYSLVRGIFRSRFTRMPVCFYSCNFLRFRTGQA